MIDLKEVIHLENASVVYADGSPQGRKVWSGVHLRLRAGEWLAVTGANGSGKSTLAAVLLGLCPLSAGRLRLDRAGLRICGVLQAPEAQCVGETVLEEFAYSPASAGLSDDRLREVCRKAMAGVGLLVPLEQSLQQLSGGQLQLLHLAVALAAEPDVLVLDEPTAMLDPTARSAVLAAVRGIHRGGAGIVWVTHRMEEAAAAQRVAAFAERRVVFDGEPRAFFYGGDGRPGVCDALGFLPPYAVRTAQLLRERGIRLGELLPLTPEELAKAVTAACP